MALNELISAVTEVDTVHSNAMRYIHEATKLADDYLHRNGTGQLETVAKELVRLGATITVTFAGGLSEVVLDKGNYRKLCVPMEGKDLFIVTTAGARNIAVSTVTDINVSIGNEKASIFYILDEIVSTLELIGKTTKSPAVRFTDDRIEISDSALWELM